jgi:hypothetical protein
MPNVAGKQIAGARKINRSVRKFGLPIAGAILKTPASFVKRPQLARSFLLLTALYAALVSVPAPPPHLGAGLDESWRIGLNLAQANHLIFGRDVIFSYGPLGYLITPQTVSGTPAAAFVYHIGIYLLWLAALSRITAVVRVDTVAFWTTVILTLGMLLDVFSRENRLETTLIAVLLVPLAEQTRWRYVELCVGGFLAALAIMVKLNTGIEAVIIFLAVLTVVVLRDRPLSRTAQRQAFAALASLPACVIFFCFLSAKNLGNLWPYLRTGWEIVAGYSQMGVPGPLWQAALYFALSGLVFLSLPFVAENVRSLWAGYTPAALVAFVQLKHAVVRQEPGHAAPFLIWFAVSLLFLLVCAKTARDRRLILSFQLFSVVMGYAITAQSYGPSFQTDISDKLRMRLLFSNFTAFLHWPSTWKTLALNVDAQSLSHSEDRFDRIVGQSPIASVGWNIQAIAAHRWKWNPVPVLQLYSAYTPALDAINAAQLESNSAAEFALVDFDDIDSRHPLFSEPLSWRALLDRYEVESESGDAVLMRRRSTSRFQSPLLLSSEVTGWDRNVTIPQIDGWLLMSPHITQTVRGKLRSFLLRPSPVFVDLTLRSGRNSRWRTIPSNMVNGVLVHPFLESSSDLSLLTAGAATPQHDILSVRLHTEDPSQYSDQIVIQWLRLPAESSRLSTGFPSTETLAANKLFDQFGVDGLRNLPPLGEIVFANPASRFALPGEHIQHVRFQFGVFNSALQASPPPDGVIFRVILKHSTGHEDVLWMRTLTPVSRPEDRGMQDAELSVNGSSEDQLIFETLPVKNPISNWAFWRGVMVSQ